MWLKVLGLVLFILLLIGIYAAFSSDEPNRCRYSEHTHEIECYDPRG